ncbi:MAG: ABC transporter ATP-binding protein [Anaerolineales bacterium]|nr:ABC transporter ATP-binding protein [Anaerolineales bacterium]
MRSDSLAPAAIALLNVTKCYGAFAAVSDLDLTVPAGEVLGFLGPNGAGKTTTIRLLLGFLRPSAGAVQLLGHDMADPAAALQARGRLGFVPDVAGLDLAATGLWLLDDLARLQRRPPIDRDRLVDALELRRQDLRRPMGRLSRGTRQKINIVQGMQHRPDLLILDEPTEGLDPLAKRALFGLLRELHGRRHDLLLLARAQRGRGSLRPRRADPRRAAGGGRSHRRFAQPDAAPRDCPVG